MADNHTHVTPKKLTDDQIRAAAHKIIAEKYSDSTSSRQRSEIVRNQAVATIDAGYNVTDVGRGGKYPKGREWQNGFRDKTFLSGPRFDALGNYGIKTGQQYLIDENDAVVPDPGKAWLLVIDFDRNKDVDGSSPKSAIRAFRDEFVQHEGDEAYERFMVAAGRAESPNGEHLYCLLPMGVMMKGRMGIKKFPVSQKGDGSAIDLRCRGNQVLAHGSETATVCDADGSVIQYGGTYQWKPNGFKRYCDLPTLAESMCKWFGAALVSGDTVTPESDDFFSKYPQPCYAKPPTDKTRAPGLGFSPFGRKPKDANLVKAALQHSTSTTPSRYLDYDSWLNGIALPLAGAVATGELSEEEAKSIYDAACNAAPGSKTANEEQWEKNLNAARSRLESGDNLLGVKSVFDQAIADGWVNPAPAQPAHIHVWPGGSLKSGAPILNALNAEAVAEKLGIAVRRNERFGQHEVYLPDQFVPQLSTMTVGWNRYDDPVMRLVTNIISVEIGRSFPITVVDEAIQLIGDRLSFDPILDWFEDLAWDGVPRLDTWLATYLGVNDTPLHRQWARLWLVGAVARTYAPGCKFDYVLMLVGKQGAGKSSIGPALIGEEYFTDQVEAGSDGKTIIEQTSGALIVELDEGLGISTKNDEAIKHMASTQKDKARLAYARKVTEILRRFVMYGSSNLDTPLRDPTGNRRFWTVEVGGILLEELARDARQLWAEAVHVFKNEFAGDARRVKLEPKWYDEATEAQKGFTEAPAWEDKLARLLDNMIASMEIITRSDGRLARWVPTVELMDRLLAPGVDIHNGHYRKLADAMKALDWISDRRGGKRGYFKKVELSEIAADVDTNDMRLATGASLQ